MTPRYARQAHGPCWQSERRGVAAPDPALVPRAALPQRPTVRLRIRIVKTSHLCWTLVLAQIDSHLYNMTQTFVSSPLLVSQPPAVQNEMRQLPPTLRAFSFLRREFAIRVERQNRTRFTEAPRSALLPAAEPPTTFSPSHDRIDMSPSISTT